MSAGQGRPIALVEHGEMARSGIEPDVENVVLLAERSPQPHLAHVCAGRQQFGGGSFIPDVGGVLAEESHDAVENLAIRDAARGRLRNRTR